MVVELTFGRPDLALEEMVCFFFLSLVHKMLTLIATCCLDENVSTKCVDCWIKDKN